MMPTLSGEEISVAEQYYRSHQAEMDAQDRAATEYRQEQIRLHKLRFPDEDSAVVRERLMNWLKKRRQEANGEGPSR